MAQYRNDIHIYDNPSEMMAPSNGETEEEYGETGWDSMSSDRSNLIINYLPHDIDDTSLKSIFAEHGEITMAKVVRDKHTKKSLGYGFVKYLNYEDACDAVQNKNGLCLGPKTLKVSFARPASDDIRNCKLYVTNLPKDYSESDVIELFQQFGDIIECRVLRERNTRSNRGVAFVQFNVKAQAHSALALNGFRPMGCDRNLVVKYAEDQNKRRDRRVMGGVHMMGAGMDGYIGAGAMKVGFDQYSYEYPSHARLLPGAPPAMPIHMQGGMTWGLRPMSDGMSAVGINGAPYVSGPVTYARPKQVPHVGSMSGLAQGSAPVWYTSLNANALPLAPPSSHDRGAMSIPPIVGIPNMNRRPTHPSDEPASKGGHTGSTRLHANAQTQLSSFPGPVPVVISNLPPHADIALLHELLTPYGRIISAQIEVVDPSAAAAPLNVIDASNSSSPTSTPATSPRLGGLCSGHGRVQIAGMPAARFATQALNGATIFEGGLPLQVSIAYEDISYDSGAGNSYRMKDPSSAPPSAPHGQREGGGPSPPSRSLPIYQQYPPITEMHSQRR